MRFLSGYQPVSFLIFNCFVISFSRLEKLKLKYPAEKLNRNIASTYPIIHERVVILIAKFIMYKR